MSAVRASRVAMHNVTSPRASFSCMRFAKATAERSVTIARVELVENAQVGRPVMAAATGIVVFVLLRGLGAHRVGNFETRQEFLTAIKLKSGVECRLSRMANDLKRTRAKSVRLTR